MAFDPKAYGKEHYRKNRAEYLARAKARNEEQADKIKAYQAEYRAKNKEKQAAYMKQWQKDNAAKLSKGRLERKLTQKKATPPWADHNAMMAYYQATQLAKEYGLDFQVDHIVPLRGDTVNGLHCEDNLQILPAKENLAKGNRHWPDMWE